MEQQAGTESPYPQDADERLRHALIYLDEARRTVVQALNELARQEHESADEALRRWQ